MFILKDLKVTGRNRRKYLINHVPELLNLNVTGSCTEHLGLLRYKSLPVYCNLLKDDC